MGHDNFQVLAGLQGRRQWSSRTYPICTSQAHRNGRCWQSCQTWWFWVTPHQTRNHNIPDPVQTTPSSANRDDRAALTNDNPNTPTTNTIPPVLKHTNADKFLVHHWLLFAAYNMQIRSISPPQLTVIAIKLGNIDNGAQCIIYLTNAITNFLDTLLEECDNIFGNPCLPHNMNHFFKGLLAHGQFWTQGFQKFADRFYRDGFNILALVPLWSTLKPTTSFATIREEVGKTLDNFTKDDTSVKINIDIQQSTCLPILDNLVFLCCLFMAIQCNNNKPTTHIAPFLYKAAMQLSDTIYNVISNVISNVVSD